MQAFEFANIRQTGIEAAHGRMLIQEVLGQIFDDKNLTGTGREKSSLAIRRDTFEVRVDGWVNDSHQRIYGFINQFYTKNLPRFVIVYDHVFTIDDRETRCFSQIRG